MFKKSKYLVESNQIRIYSKRNLTNVYFFIGIAVSTPLLFMFLLSIILTNLPILVILRNSLILIPFIITSFIPFLISLKHQIIFDLKKGYFYEKGLFKTSNPISYNKVDSIIYKTVNYNSGYFINLKEDKYGKGIFIHQKSRIFDRDVLSVIEKVISENVLSTSEKNTSISLNNLNYYKHINNKFFSKTIMSSLWEYGFYLFLFIGLQITAIDAYKDGETADFIKLLIFIPLIPNLLIIGYTFRQVYFDKNTNEFVVKSFGITFQRLKLNNFIDFKVTRNYYKGIYTRTSISLNLTIKNSFPIIKIRNTNKIESFLKETEYIVNHLNK